MIISATIRLFSWRGIANRMNQPAPPPPHSTDESVRITYVLLITYTIPCWYLLVVTFLTGFFSQWRTLTVLSFDFVSALSPGGSAGGALNEFHQILLPLISGLSVIRIPKQERSTVYRLIVFTLACFAACLFVNITLSVESIQTNVLGHSVPKENITGAVNIVQKIRETVFIYFAVLAGLQVKKMMDAQ